MAIKSQADLRSGLLSALANKENETFATLIDTLATLYGINSDQEKEQLYNSSSVAIQTLKKMNLVSKLSYGEWCITEEGKQLIDTQNSTQSLESLETEEIKLEDIINDTTTILDKPLNQILLEKLRTVEPAIFEEIVGDLLKKLGYGRFEKTPRTKDGGIDGILYHDYFGFNRIAFQAKRYNGSNAITAPTINEFVGALSTKYNTQRGVFCTTSEFTKDATELAKINHLQIKLIDGSELAQLMIDYNVGVKDSLIKVIDDNYKFFQS